MTDNTNSQKFSKSDLIFYHTRQEFPSHLINKDALNFQDILFSNDNQDPEPSNKKIKFGNCFVIEDELERKGGYKGKKPFNNQHGKNFNNPPPDSWKGKKEPEDPGFFDNFKGKSDAKQVFAFKRNMELFEIKEMNIMINKTDLIDLKENEEKEW